MDSKFHVTDQLTGYALNCLEVSEAAQVEAHLAACAACRKELHAYQEVAGLLATAVPQITPPPNLKAKVLQVVGAKPEAEEATASNSFAKPGARFEWREWIRKRPLWQPALILVLILLLISNFQLRLRLDDARTPANFGTVTLTGTEAAAHATGIIIISADGEHGTLVVQNLPQLQESEAYQLWLIKDGERTDGGLFNVDEDGYRAHWVYAPEPLASYQNFGITIEPDEGSPSPTGQKVLGN